MLYVIWIWTGPSSSGFGSISDSHSHSHFNSGCNCNTPHPIPSSPPRFSSRDPGFGIWGLRLTWWGNTIENGNGNENGCGYGNENRGNRAKVQQMQSRAKVVLGCRGTRTRTGTRSAKIANDRLLWVMGVPAGREVMAKKLFSFSFFISFQSRILKFFSISLLLLLVAPTGDGIPVVVWWW